MTNSTPLPDKTQEELEKILKDFTNDIVLNSSDAYAITEILIIARDKAKQAIELYCHKQVIEARIDELQRQQAYIMRIKGDMPLPNPIKDIQDRIAELKGKL
jgi:hypothetical protein